jgi:hypothetical protein
MRAAKQRERSGVRSQMEALRRFSSAWIISAALARTLCSSPAVPISRSQTQA